MSTDPNEPIMDALTHAITQAESLVIEDAAEGMQIARKLRDENRRIWAIVNSLEAAYWEMVYDIEAIVADAARSTRLSHLIEQGVLRINANRLRNWMAENRMDMDAYKLEGTHDR